MHLTCRCHAAITIAPAKPSIDCPQRLAAAHSNLPACRRRSCTHKLPHFASLLCRCHASVCPEEPSCCPQCSVAYDTLLLQQQQQLNHRRRKGQRDAQQPDHEAPEAALQRHQQQQHAAGTNGKHREGPLPSAPPTLFDFLDRKLSNSAGAGPDQLPRTQSGGDAAGGHCNSSGPPRLACCADDSNLEQDLQPFSPSVWETAGGCCRCSWTLGVACCMAGEAPAMLCLPPLFTGDAADVGCNCCWLAVTGAGRTPAALRLRLPPEGCCRHGLHLLLACCSLVDWLKWPAVRNQGVLCLVCCLAVEHPLQRTLQVCAAASWPLAL